MRDKSLKNVNETKLYSKSTNRLLIYLNVLIGVLIFTIFFVGNNFGELIECNATRELRFNYAKSLLTEPYTSDIERATLSSFGGVECKYGEWLCLVNNQRSIGCLNEICKRIFRN